MHGEPTMKNSGRRQVVVEIEKVQLIRKRAPSISLFCANCGQHTDFVSAPDAATLFEVDPDELFQTLRSKEVHMQVSEASGIHICVTSLMAFFEHRCRESRVRLLNGRDGSLPGR
jgi:hypothetical protein